MSPKTVEQTPKPRRSSPRDRLVRLAETPYGSPARTLGPVVDRLLSLYALRRPLSILALMLADAFALLAGLVSAGYLVGGGRWAEEAARFVPILLAMWVIVFAAHDLYDRAPSRRNPVALLKAISVGFGLLVIGGALYPELEFSVGGVLIGALFVLPLEAGMRFAYERGIELVYRQKLGLMPTLVVGEDRERQRLRRAVERLPSAYVCVGELPSNGEGVDLRALRRELDLTGARRVIMAGAEHFSEPRFVEFMRACRLRGVEVRVVPSAVTLMGATSTLSGEAGVPLLRLSYPGLDGPQRVLKRALDVAVSLGALAALSPLLLMVGLAIRLTSPGPVLFRQKRAGADGRAFVCYKFRSMRRDAEEMQAGLETKNEAGGAVFKMKEDPRVTPVGRFIRRWSIDELPQLLNVLRGEMSLVGPRPLPLRDLELMGEAHRGRLAAVPGITGYWQISGRSDLSFEEMVRLDIHYVENWSLSFDAKIILRTVGAVVRHEGAY